MLTILGVGGTSQPAIWWQIDYTGPLPSWRGGHRFGLHWNTHFLILDIDFPLLPEILLLARPSVCSRNTSFAVLVFHTILLLIREFVSEQCKCINGFVLMGIHRSYLMPCNLEAVALIEWWDGLLRTCLWYQLVWKVGVLSYGVHYMLWICNCFSHHNQGVEMGGSPLTITLNKLSAEYFPCLCNF